jgi:hypothetical protein
MACSTDYEYQKSLVVEHIENRGWPKEFLKPIENINDSCESMFIYKNDKQHIEYTVVGGYKIRFRDHNKLD